MKAVLAIMLLAVMMERAVAIRCYSCTGCDEPTSNIITCEDEEMTCSKTVANEYVVRGCGAGATKCSSLKVFGVKTKYCNCGADLCNKASTVTVSTLALLAPFVAAKLIN
ncbi:CD59B glycoprotein-like [Watersipora subatra]|uniref:CD59B glycoprotein-like n=1 Tax=Watersipora subatra TaxID=2589382 RepID=UPI00355C8882